MDWMIVVQICGRDKGVLSSPEYLDQLVGHPAFCAMGKRFFS
jgi:hypothetical protein